MKQNYFLKRGLIIVLVVLALMGCNQTSKKSLDEEKNQTILLFNKTEADEKITDVSKAELYGELIEIIKKPYQNLEAAALWIEDKIKLIISNPSDLDDNTLKSLNEELYDSDYQESSRLIAYFTIYSPYTKQFKKSKGIATATLIAHYNKIKEIDSLDKYVNLLEKNIQSDTTKWLKLSYLTNKANLSDLKGNYVEAVINYHNALKMIPVDDIENLSNIYQNLATLYVNFDYPEKAAIYIEKAIAVKGIRKLRLDQRNSIGISQRKSNQFEAAEETFLEIIKEALQKDLSIVLAQTYSNLGNVYLDQKEFDKASKVYTKSDSICNALDLSVGILINKINRGELYVQQKQYNAALEILVPAESLADMLNITPFKLGIYESLSSSYQGIGNERMSDKYFRKYTEIKNDYDGNTPKSMMIAWELENEIKGNLAKENQYLISLQKEKAKQYLIAFILGIITLLISVFYFWKSKKTAIQTEQLKSEKQQIKYNLELKSKEQLLNSLKNISVENTKKQIKEDLQALLDLLPQVHREKFTDFKRSLSTGNTTGFLDEFETRFTGVYEDFFTKIKNIAPDLTPQEIKISALIRLNISTKEMATLTNRTVGTIDNARSNIRKKLKLDDADNLNQFLADL